jgi:hypothetical protein
MRDGVMDRLSIPLFETSGFGPRSFVVKFIIKRRRGDV